MFRNVLSAAVIGAALVGGPVLTGCDKTVEKNESVEKKRDGTTVEKKSETVQKPDGSVEQTSKTEVKK